MKKYISLFLTALMLLSLLAGCGDGKTNADDGDGTRTIVLRNTASLSTNDPHATTNTHDYTVFENIYEGLYDLNEADGGYDLRLAENRFGRAGRQHRTRLCTSSERQIDDGAHLA